MGMTVVGLIACAITGLLILQPFHEGSLGFLLGLVLGPFGLAVALIRRSDRRRAEQLAQHREIVYLLRRGADERVDRASNPEQMNPAGAQ